MESVSATQGFKSRGPGFASSAINDPVDLGHIIGRSIQDTYGMSAGSAFAQQNVNHDTIVPPSGASKTGIRANLVSLARLLGRGDAKILVELGRVDNELRSSMHTLKSDTQRCVTSAKDYTSSASERMQADQRLHTNVRIQEARKSIQESVDVANANIRVVNREPDLAGQVREAIQAVLKGSQAPQQCRAVAALQAMADASLELTQFGRPLLDVPSRLERVTYVSARNTALALASAKNVETDMLEYSSKLATLSATMTGNLAGLVHRVNFETRQAVVNESTAQARDLDELAQSIGEQHKTLTALEVALRQLNDMTARALRDELLEQISAHTAMIEELNETLVFSSEVTEAHISSSIVANNVLLFNALEARLEDIAKQNSSRFASVNATESALTRLREECRSLTTRVAALERHYSDDKANDVHSNTALSRTSSQIEGAENGFD